MKYTQEKSEEILKRVRAKYSKITRGVVQNGLQAGLVVFLLELLKKQKIGFFGFFFVFLMGYAIFFYFEVIPKPIRITLRSK